MAVLREVCENLYYIGGNDRRISRFENMFELPYGISYNSYIFTEEKTCVMDAVDTAIAELYYDNVRAALNGRKLDYLWVNHVEPDHCGTINGLLREYPECKLILGAKALEFLKQFYTADYEGRYEIFKDGDVLDLGTTKLKQVAAPNVHWPEVTMAYAEGRGMLFSADAFGSFRALEGHLFSDGVDYLKPHWLAESRRYYVNIVGKQGPSVQRLLKKLGGSELKMILPLHGMIIRGERDINALLEKYNLWSTYTAEEAGVTLIYSSMYGNSALATDFLAGELADAGVSQLRIFDVSETEFSFMIADLFRFSHAVFFCNVYNTDLFPTMDALLRDVRMLGWDNHSVALLGNLSWGGKALATAKGILEGAKKLEFIENDILLKSAMKEEDKPKLRELAKRIAAGVQAFASKD